VAVPPKNLERKRRMSADLKAVLENAEEEAQEAIVDNNAALRQQAEDFFGRADLNNDGTLSKNELKKLIKKDAPLKAKLVPAGWGAFFGELDSDGDGIIDKEEFVQFYISKCSTAQHEPSAASGLVGGTKCLMRRGTQGHEYTPEEVEEEVAVPPKNLERKRRMSADLKAALENAEEEGQAAVEAAEAGAEEEEAAVPPKNLERKRRMSADLKAALENAEEEGQAAAEASAEEEEAAVPPKNLERKRRMSADLKAALENAEEGGQAAAEAVAEAAEAEAKEEVDDLFGTPKNPVQSTTTAAAKSDDIMDLFGDFSGGAAAAPAAPSDSVMMASSNDSSDPFNFGDFGSAPVSAPTSDSTMSASANDSLFDLLGDFNSAPAPPADDAVSPVDDAVAPVDDAVAPVDPLDQAFEENVPVAEDSESSNPEDKLTQSSTGAWLTTDGRKWLSTPKGKSMAIKHQKALDKK